MDRRIDNPIERLRAAYLLVEQEARLFERRAEGAPIWELIRYQAFQAWTMDPALGLTPALKTPGSQTRAERILEKDPTEATAPPSPPLVTNPADPRVDPERGGPCELLVLGHPRRKRIDGRWVDLYVDPLLPALSNQFDVRVVEPGWLPHCQPAATPDLRWLNPIDMSFQKTVADALNEGPPKELATDLTRIATQIVTAISADAGVPGDALFQALNAAFLTTASRALARWRISRPAYREFLLRLRPRAVVLVNSQGHQALIAAAREIGVPTIELQHGSPGAGKLNYDYPAGQRCETFPDAFMTFGSFWADACNLPLPAERILPLGFAFLRDYGQRNRPMNDDRRALFISQLHARDDLADAALALRAIEPASTQIFWKDHPIEETVDSPAHSRLEAAGVTRLPPQSDLYAEISKAPLIVGAYSTALFEAVHFGRRPQLIPCRESRAMQQLVDAEGASYVTAPSFDTPLEASEAVRQSLFFERSDAQIAASIAHAISLGPMDHRDGP